MATGGGGCRPISLSSEPFYDFPCTVCAKDDKLTEGDRFCVECNETFCTSCLIFHNKIAIMRQHKLLDMLTRKSQLETVQLPVTKQRKDSVQLPTTECTVHAGQTINMYCGQHDLVCCTVCIAEDHRNCLGVIYIPTKAKNIKSSQELQDVNAAIDTMRADLEMMKKGKKLDLEVITSHHLQTQASIQKTRVQLNKHLDDLEASMREELKRKFKFHADQINDTIAKLEFELLEMEKSGVKLMDAENESQLFVDMKKAKMKYEEGRKLIDNADISVEKPSMHFVPNHELFKILEIKSFGILEDQKTFTSVSHHSDFNIRTPNDKYYSNTSGTCQMLDGNIVMSDNTNEKLVLLDRSYKIKAECKLPSSPKNVCRTRTTEVAITLASKKEVLFAEVTDKISLKRSFSIDDICRGIVYNKGLLYLTCGGCRNECPGQVQVFDMAGKLLQTFMNWKLFSIPSDIVVSKCRTKLHIADKDNGIVAINLDGTEPWNFTSPDMVQPRGICLVNNDDLIVCGIDSHNVVMFDKNGQQKVILLQKEDGIKKPCLVFFDRPNSRLIVSMTESEPIKVYNLL